MYIISTSPYEILTDKVQITCKASVPSVNYNAAVYGNNPIIMESNRLQIAVNVELQ